jgi:cytoskeletal protein RodZ
MDSAGVELKKIRLEKGLSLEEVHKKTKIDLNILKALEEDSLINLSPIYIKGFLKIYCKFLGVDPRDYIPSYKEPQTTPIYISGREEEPVSLLKTASSRLGSLKLKQIKTKTVVIFLLILIFFIGLFNLGKFLSSKRNLIFKKSKDMPAKIEKKETKAPTQTQAPKVVKPQAGSGPKNQEIIPVPPSATLGIGLGIHAKEDCFIQLKTDGKIVFQGVLKKGRSENWQAKNKIEFSLGNAGVVDLEVNGKRILPLGRRGQAVKNILIDKEGIKTKR